MTAEGHPQVVIDNDGLRARTFDQASGQSGIVCQQRSNADQDGIMMSAVDVLRSWNRTLIREGHPLENQWCRRASGHSSTSQREHRTAHGGDARLQRSDTVLDVGVVCGMSFIWMTFVVPVEVMVMAVGVHRHRQ